MNFNEILKKNNNKEEILLGYKNSKHLTLNIKRNPSIIITGETGSGKSILLDQILTQLITKYTSYEMGIMPIDTSGVELNYYKDSKYSLYSAINDEEKSIVALSRVLKEIDRRKEIIRENNCSTVYEFNTINDNKLPFIVIAIDDDKFLLRNPDIEKMLSAIITQIDGLNMLFVLATSDVHNKFFELDRNTLASLLITFDYTNEVEAMKANIEGAEKLPLGVFIAKINDDIEIYNSYEFDDSIIMKVLDV